MAQRPVYCVKMVQPFFECKIVDFTYNAGMAVCQKQKNIVAIHKAFQLKKPESKVLEISSKSLQPLGVKLSAFNLLKYVPSIDKKIPVENVYQAGKTFSCGGPFLDLYEATARAAKSDERLNQSGNLTGFYFEGKSFPLIPKTAFYDWIYINALLENEELAEQIMQYDAFTDIEFNPNKSINCQAKAAALFVSLKRLGKEEAFNSFEDFIRVIKG